MWCSLSSLTAEHNFKKEHHGGNMQTIHNVCFPRGSAKTDTRTCLRVFHVRKGCFDRRFSLWRAQSALKYRKLWHLLLKCVWSKSKSRVEMAIFPTQNDRVLVFRCFFSLPFSFNSWHRCRVWEEKTVAYECLIMEEWDMDSNWRLYEWAASH